MVKICTSIEQSKKLLELAFDGACIGQYELDLLERIKTSLKEL